MHVLFVVLNHIEYLDDLLTKFADIGVKGGTILDSQGMASAILAAENRNIPLFGYFESLIGDTKTYNKTLFTVLESDELLEKAILTVQEVTGDLKHAGFMFSVPIKNVYSMGKATD